MKAHLTKVSLALLSTVFLLGCQDLGSEPVGPEGLGPEFAAKTCDENPKQGKCKAGDDDTGGAGGLFYDSPGGKDIGYTCEGGAIPPPGDNPTIFGQVTWGNIRRTDEHIHGDITLNLAGATGFVPGIYMIVGNQDVLCNKGIVDFHLRHGHPPRFEILEGESGAIERTIALTFGQNHIELQDPDGHKAGKHLLWLTIIGPGVPWDDDNPRKHGEVYHDAFGHLLTGSLEPEGCWVMCENILEPDLVLRSTAVEVTIKKHSGH